MTKLDLTRGSVGKALLRFSLPFLLSYFLQTLYGMADLYIIGQFCGVESTTAVSIGSQVMHMVTVIIVGLAMGSVVVIGQTVGAGAKARLEKAVGNTVSLFLLLSLGGTLLLLALGRPLVSWISTPAAAIPGTIRYLQICFWGIPLITGYNVISSILRGMGDSKTPMYLIAGACLMNIALDYLFIGYFQLGPSGTALGTTLSQSFSVLLSLLFIRRRGELQLSARDFWPERETLGKILKIGLPVALQDGFIQISFMLVTVFVNQRGLEDAAAVGIVEKLISLLFLLPSSMLQTVSTLSAQNIGAGKPRRARASLSWGCGICVLWGLGAVVLMTFSAEQIIGLFSKDPRTIQLGTQYMQSYVWDCVFAGVHFCFSGYFCACGRAYLSFLHNAISILLVRLPFSYMAATYFLDSLFPMGLASTVGSLLSVLLCLGLDAYFRRRDKESPGKIPE